MRRAEVVAEMKRWIADAADVERRLVRYPHERDSEYRIEARRVRDVHQRAVDMLEADERKFNA